VKADDEAEAIAKARAFLQQEHWELLSIHRSDRLIDSAVRAHGAEVLELYEEALDRGIATNISPKNFAPGKSGIPAIRPPRVTEKFIGRLVKDVGGERLPTDDKNRMVDYRILTPVAFTVNGLDFSWLPPEIPPDWRPSP